jgi:hypothetical protein
MSPHPSHVDNLIDRLAKNPRGFFAAWAVIGIPADKPSQGVHVSSCPEAMREALDDQILAMAAEIVKRRGQ